MKQFAVIFAFAFLWPGAAFPSLAKMVTQNGSARASFNYNLAERSLALSGLRQAAREMINGVGRNVDYFYDPLNRLTKETVGAASLIYDTTPGYGDSAGFDKVGNRRSRSAALGLPAQSFTYNARDGISGDTVDKNGNTTLSGGVSYTYYFENRLKTAGANITIHYDGDGHRIRKTANGTTTHYLVDELNPTGYAQVLLEKQGADPASAAITKKYVWGQRLISQTIGANTYYYTHDGHGSVRALVNGTTVTNAYDHDAFGNRLSSSTGSTDNNYRYAGEQWDEQLGMYYLRARYEHPDHGRFWTMDTFEGSHRNPLIPHKYLYAHANPVNNLDPSGHFAEGIVGAINNAALQGYVRTATFVAARPVLARTD